MRERWLPISALFKRFAQICGAIACYRGPSKVGKYSARNRGKHFTCRRIIKFHVSSTSLGSFITIWAGCHPSSHTKVESRIRNPYPHVRANGKSGIRAQQLPTDILPNFSQLVGVRRTFVNSLHFWWKRLQCSGCPQLTMFEQQPFEEISKGNRDR